MSDNNDQIPLLSHFFEQGQTPDYLLWVGCAGSLDANASKTTIAFYKILKSAGLRFAVLGKEESCTGDPAKRVGNEYLFQLQAFKNIQTFNTYKIRKIITTCPHCFNIFKNEYPELGGDYEIYHHTQIIDQLIQEKKIKFGKSHHNQSITFHDPCYLARANQITQAPRDILRSLGAKLVEMKHHKQHTLCCGAGGGQMFKESESGHTEINMERFNEAKQTKATTVATACPFCNIMMQDASQKANTQQQVKDIAELIAQNLK